jgi:hypothetical protein
VTLPDRPAPALANFQHFIKAKVTVYLLRGQTRPESAVSYTSPVILTYKIFENQHKQLGLLQIYKL